MATLKDILIRQYGYRRADFGATGLVRVDCSEATISPVPLEDIFTPRSVSPAKVVRLDSLFRPGQIVELRGVGRERLRRFRVLAVSGEGLTVDMADAGRQFLPWQALRQGLIRPELISFAPARPPEGRPAERRGEGALRSAG